MIRRNLGHYNPGVFFAKKNGKQTGLFLSADPDVRVLVT